MLKYHYSIPYFFSIMCAINTKVTLSLGTINLRNEVPGATHCEYKHARPVISFLCFSFYAIKIDKNPPRKTKESRNVL